MNNFEKFKKCMMELIDSLEKYDDEKQDIILRILWHSYIDAFLKNLYGIKEENYEILEDPLSICGLEIIKSMDSLLMKELVLLKEISEEDVSVAREFRKDFSSAAYSVSGALTPVLRTRPDWCSTILEMEAAIYSMSVDSALFIGTWMCEMEE